MLQGFCAGSLSQTGLQAAKCVWFFWVHPWKYLEANTWLIDDVLDSKDAEKASEEQLEMDRMVKEMRRISYLLLWNGTHPVGKQDILWTSLEEPQEDPDTLFAVCYGWLRLQSYEYI